MPALSRALSVFLFALSVGACNESPTVPAQERASPSEPLATLTGPGAEPLFVWIRQHGSSWDDGAYAIARGASGVFIGGTLGLGPAFSRDAYLRHYDEDGNTGWTERFGPTGASFILGTAISGSDLYGVGVLGGSFLGGGTATIGKYAAATGSLVWEDQIPDLTATDVATDGTVAYVAAEGNDLTVPVPNHGRLLAYDAGTGTLLWQRGIHGFVPPSPFPTFGPPSDAEAVAQDVSGIYVAGALEGAFEGETSAGGLDAYVQKYDEAGAVLWSRQVGSSGIDAADGVAAAGGGVYVVGSTHGTLPGQTSAGDRDAFIARFSAAGDLLWLRQFGTSATESAVDVTADDAGAWVVGFTAGALDGAAAGSFDAFVRRYDTAGNVVWTIQFGTAEPDLARGVAADENALYVAGSTAGALPGQTSVGGSDAFVLELATPEQQLDAAADAIDDLVSAGAITGGQGSSLQAKLAAALRQMSEENAPGAIGILRAFINEVEALIASGALTPEEGQSFIDTANALIAALGG